MSDTVAKYQEYVITSFTKAVQPITIESAKGAVVRDESGREIIDCFAGISVVNAGHGNPHVVQAAKAQMERLIHCCSYVYHVPAVADLAEKMSQITPGALKKTFFANSGAEAIEGALKLAKLYTGKHEIIALQTGFHGRTWGALSVTGNAGRKRRGGPYAPGVTFAPVPYFFRSDARDPAELGKRCASALEEIIRFSTSDDVAAFIAEPVLGEGGIIVPPDNYFREVKEVLERHNILFIADEVQTGFGRTGHMFAIEHYGVEPDIIVTAKGIADGFPLGGFTTRDEIAAAFQPGDHLSTFGGNPVSCAAALANICFLEREDVCSMSAQLGSYCLGRLGELRKQHKVIGDVRGRGMMIGIELVGDRSKSPAPKIAEAIRVTCLEKGLIVGVGGVNGNVVRIQPPLVITREQLDLATTILDESMKRFD